jgi:hypothetical protein
MEKRLSLFLASALAFLSVSGFVKRKKPKHLAGLMNVDTQHSVIRLPLTLALLSAGSSQASLRKTRAILSLVGAVYLVMGTAGLIDKRVGGLLPSKQTNFDLVYHFGVGMLVLWMGTRSGKMMK